MKSPRDAAAEYDPGAKLHGYELRVILWINHNEGENEHSPDWRTDNILELEGERASKLLYFLKTLD